MFIDHFHLKAPHLPLRNFLRRHFNDNQRFILVCLICGLLCGVVAVCLHYTIHLVFHHLWDWAQEQPTAKFIGIMLLAPTLAGLIVGFATQKFSPESVGSGIPQTKVAFFNRGGKVRTKTGLWRFLLTSLYCGLGNSLGREGPTIHISSAISSRLGRSTFADPARIQSITPIGMAAGIAAAFNAPLSAITFVFEELLDNFSMKSLGGIVIAVVTAAAVSRSLLGEDPVLSSHLAEHYETSAWMLVAVPLGAFAGLLGALFENSILALRKRLKKRSNPMLHTAMGGLCCGILGLGGFYLTGLVGDPQHSVFSIGYESLTRAFEAQLAIQIIVVLLVLKFIAVVVNYATGGSGGLFSPTLFLGGMLGCLVGFGLVAVHQSLFSIPAFPSPEKVIGGCVLLGMGAMFSSVIRCPFTSLIIIFEMTGNYSLILPLMAGNILSWQFARMRSPLGIYDNLLVQDGINLREFPNFQGAQDYRNLPISAIMTYDVLTLEGSQTIAATLKRIQQDNLHFHGYPVLDQHEYLLGVATHHEIEDAAPDSQLQALVEDQKTITALPTTSILNAANLMIKHDIQQLPIISPNNPKKLLGLITLNDIARQQNSAG